MPFRPNNPMCHVKIYPNLNFELLYLGLQDVEQVEV